MELFNIMDTFSGVIFKIAGHLIWLLIDAASVEKRRPLSSFESIQSAVQVVQIPHYISSGE